jgi:hypothetical protein
MTSTKNPGLGARTASVSAAIAASKGSGPHPSAPAVEEVVVATSVRIPKSKHDDLSDFVHAERKRGNRISIHSLILEGIDKVIKEMIKEKKK